MAVILTRMPTRRLLSVSASPPTSQFGDSNCTWDWKTRLPWKNFGAGELPRARKHSRESPRSLLMGTRESASVL